MEDEWETGKAPVQLKTFAGVQNWEQRGRRRRGWGECKSGKTKYYCVVSIRRPDSFLYEEEVEDNICG